MLFLGSGASKPMGIDCLSEITVKVVQSLSPRLKEIIHQLEDIFAANKELLINFNIDIEALFSIFDCLVNRKRILNDMGPFAILMHHFVANNDEFRQLEISNDEFQNFKETVASTLSDVIGRYGYGDRSNEQKSTAIQLYDGLFAIPARNNNQFPNALRHMTAGIFNVVATVNYDLVLEIYNRSRFLTRSGFKSEGGVDILQIQEITQGSVIPEYIKLHGSIDWWLNEQGMIVRSLHRDNPFEELTDRSMIYPIYEKFVSKDPFFALYQYFRKMLFREDILIVIGFSFRDPSINNAFADWLSTRPSSRLIIVARQEKQNKIRAIFDNNTRIQFIDTYFGQNGFINSLENVLTNPV
jgi:hypothetical protein